MQQVQPMSIQDEKKTLPLEDAQLGLVRLVKAAGFYPPNHPALQAAAFEAATALAPLLVRGEPLILHIHREGIHEENRPLVAAHPLLKKFAAFLFARRLKTLTVLPEFSPRDLLLLARSLTLEPAEIQHRGGLGELLKIAGVTTLWANETDLSQILFRKAELEKEQEAAPEQEHPGDFLPEGLIPECAPLEIAPEEETFTSEDIETLTDLLRREESDVGARRLLRELESLIRLRLQEDFRYPVLDALTFLLAQGNSPEASPARREEFLQTLNRLGGRELIDFLVDFLDRRDMEDDLREGIVRLLLFFGEGAALPLMERLTKERDPQGRRTLMETLAALEEKAIPVLIEHLGSGEWYVTRNAIAVLGEIRLQETVSVLRPLLGHADPRVRREAIRALTRIGGGEAVNVLLQTIEGEDEDLSRQALLSLGALRHSAAVPALLDIIARPDPLVKQPELRRGAVKALGEIGAVESIPALVRILQSRTLWRRSQTNEVRAAAALALGDIDSGQGIPALEQALNDRSPEVARAAAQALKQLKKGSHGSRAG